MSAFGGNYRIDENGYYTGYQQSGWDSFLGKSTEDEQRYMNEWNTALRQYEQQYGLQQEAFNLDKQNLQFNQNLATEQLGLQKEAQQANLANLKFNQELATRQQNLSEESYRSGVLNQARQLQSLGINPAAMGQSLSGLSMSGGSNVSGVSSGSAGSVAGVGSRGNPTAARAQAISKYASRKQAQMQGMATLMQYATQKKQADIAQQEANTASYNAQTQRYLATGQVGVNNATIDQIRESVDYLREHGHLPGSGYSSTFSNSVVRNVLDVVSLYVMAKMWNNNNNNRNGKNGPDPNVPAPDDNRLPRHSSAYKGKSSSYSWSMDAPRVSLPLVSQPLTIDSLHVDTRFLNKAVETLKDMHLPVPEVVDEAIYRKKGFDWSELSREISKALDDMNGQAVSSVVRLMPSFITGVPSYI